MHAIDRRLDRPAVARLIRKPGCRTIHSDLDLAGPACRRPPSCSSLTKLIGIAPAPPSPVRGRQISYVAQDPAVALDPAIRVAAEIEEIARIHGLRRECNAEQLLRTVGLPSDRSFRRRFPHELSGGQLQRLAIAIALACAPGVVVLDEPTTALDVITQAQLLAEVKRLTDDLRLAVVYVSHDLSVVASIADRIAVMYAGRVVELAPTPDLIRRPRHPYSLGLIASIPDHEQPRVLKGIPGVSISASDAPAGCSFAARCIQQTAECSTGLPALEPLDRAHFVRCLHWRETPPPSALELRSIKASATPQPPVLAVLSLRASHAGGTVSAAADVSFEVAAGECLALVGESGSGKSTIARSISGLHPQDSGEILLHGRGLARRAKDRSREQRRQLQIVFQNPYDSLNPRRTIEEAIGRPIELFSNIRGQAMTDEINRLLDLVRLPSRLATRFPHELSGGERQRVAIARALAAHPSVIVCDEITSALDVSVQAVVLDVLAELRRTLGLALVLITHDLGVVASVADTVVVLQSGVVRECGGIAATLGAPADDYTRRLLDAAPTIATWLSPDEPSATLPPPVNS